MSAEYWHVGDAGFTVFGPPRVGHPAPEVIASVKRKVNSPLLAAAPELLAALRETAAELYRLAMKAPDLNPSVDGVLERAARVIARFDRRVCGRESASGYYCSPEG